MATFSVADARANLFEIVESAVATHERFAVTRNGARVAVLLAADDYDSLLETVSVLSDSEAMATITYGLEELQEAKTASADEVRASMIRAGRLPE